MGRKLEFDRDKALTSATELFWKEGYVNTSMKQLLSAMNMGESSFYNTFKSKKSLYIECLNHYNNVLMVERSQIIDSDEPAKNRLEKFFEVVILDMKNNKCSGCFFSNSLVSEVLSEEDLKQYIFECTDNFLQMLEKLVSDGIAEGDFKKGLNTKQTARMLLTYLHGLQKLSAFSFNQKEQKAETKVFIDALLLA